MNVDCGKEWTRKYIRDTFPQSFIKTWRENVLLEREKALLPATQIYAERRLRLRAINEEISQIKSAYNTLREKQLVRTMTVDPHMPLSAFFEQIESDGRELLRREMDLRDTKKALLGNPPLAAAGGAAAGGAAVSRFMRRCSVDDCLGYISTDWKCGLCSTWACSECHEVIGKDKYVQHTCDPNNVETARMLKKDTKPCPKCSTSIFKIDGCDQIWCTQCHTAFSWKTGRLETKIHNPHYYEWLRNTQGSVPREPLDIPVACGEGLEVGDDMIRQFTLIIQDQHKNRDILNSVLEIIQNIIHIQEFEIRPDNYELRNRIIRIDYLLKEIDENRFKARLQQSDKKTSKKRDIQTVYEMVVAVTSDILRRFLRQLMYTRTNPGDTTDTSILDEVTALSKYANECLLESEYVYGGKVSIFTPTLRLTSIDNILFTAFDIMQIDRKYMEGISLIKRFVFLVEDEELNRHINEDCPKLIDKANAVYAFAKKHALIDSHNNR